MFVHNCS
ncbi:hypothetical protein VCHENC02_3642A, partial [Vibrio harveyi]